MGLIGLFFKQELEVAWSLLWEAGSWGLVTGNVMVGNSLEQPWGPKILPIVGAAFTPNLQGVAGMEKAKRGCFSPLLPTFRSSLFSQDGSTCRERPHWGKKPEPVKMKRQGVATMCFTAAPALQCHWLGTGLIRAQGTPSVHRALLPPPSIYQYCDKSHRCK